MATGQQYTHLAANAATTIKSAYGTLHAVIINKSGGSANVVTLADALSGATPVIATIDGTAAPQALIYELDFKTGLTVTLATGTAADITVVWS